MDGYFLQECFGNKKGPVDRGRFESKQKIKGPDKRALLKIIRGNNFEALTFNERAEKFNYIPYLFRSSNICNKYRYE